MLKFKEVKAYGSDLQKFTVRRARMLYGHVFKYEAYEVQRTYRATHEEAFSSTRGVRTECWGVEFLEGARHYGRGRFAKHGFKTRQEAAGYLIQETKANPNWNLKRN